MPQLARMTPKSGTSLKRRCPYHAKVMKRLEANRSRIGKSLAESVMVGMGCPEMTGERVGRMYGQNLRLSTVAASRHRRRSSRSTAPHDGEPPGQDSRGGST